MDKFDPFNNATPPGWSKATLLDNPSVKKKQPDSVPIFDVNESPLVYGDLERFTVYPYADDDFIACVPLREGWFIERCRISESGQLQNSDGEDWGYDVFAVAYWMPLPNFN